MFCSDIINKGINKLYRLFIIGEPFIHLGEEKYHRTWYFSKKALISLVINQLNLFSSIEFIDSLHKKGLVIAF